MNDDGDEEIEHEENKENELGEDYGWFFNQHFLMIEDSNCNA
jgi:hypothetical protein